VKGPVFSCSTLFLIGILLAACGKQNLPSVNTTPTAMPILSAPLHYLALGDSYTIGQGVSETERFPYLTVAILRKQNIQFNAPKYIATTGWTTANLQAAIEAGATLHTFDVVSLLIGVNDQYQHLDTAGYKLRFEQLLQKAIALAGERTTHVFVLSIPDYSATPFVADTDKARVQNDLQLFNAINKEVSLHYKVTYIDITPLTREAAADLSLLADDQLHYSAKAHQQWAERLAEAIRQSLR
jgi:lysophospholipase L1-like esterase